MEDNNDSSDIYNHSDIHCSGHLSDISTYQSQYGHLQTRVENMFGR